MEEKFLTTTDNSKIFYKNFPDGKKKTTLILLHGLGGDMEAWMKDVEIFQKLGYSVIAVDLRGHGRSERPADENSYNFKRFAQDVVEIIEQEKVRSPIVLGHCFGGVIAMMIELYFPKVLKALILIDTTYKPHFLAKGFSEHASLQYLLRVAIKLAPTIHDASVRDYEPFVGTKDIDIRRLWGDITHTSLKSYLLASELLINMPAEKFLEKITVPTLVVEGIEDTIFPLELAAVMYERIKHSAIDFIEDANHILVLNNPGELAATVDRFVENLKGV